MAVIFCHVIILIMVIILFQILVFLGAFLLFQIELIIAKFYLPVFGGEFWVWGACVVFFQATLLLGYAQAHFVFHRLGLNRYKILHGVLLLLPLLFFPGRMLKDPVVVQGIPLVLNVFLELCVTIGPAFFVLSTLSIVLQSWLVNSKYKAMASPYALYALSNVGSFAALLSYPFFFESAFDLVEQQRIWRGGYFILLAFHAVLYLAVLTKEALKEKSLPTEIMSRRETITLLILGAAGSVMFLSVTNIVTAEVAPIPLFWVIPLSIYLLSFTLNFMKRPWYPEVIDRRMDVILGLSGLLYFIILKRFIPFVLEAVFLCAVLFLICMFCQRQLYLLRPKDDKNMTLFYVIFSLGSFLGGIFVSWIAPLIFTSLIEYLIAILLTCAFLVFRHGIKNLNLRQLRILAYLVLFMAFWPVIFREYNFWAVSLLVLFIGVTYRGLGESKNGAVGIFFGIFIFLVFALTAEPIWKRENQVFKSRNYYGIYTVTDYPQARYLASYTTFHGAQFRGVNKQDIPAMYYGPTTAVGRILGSEHLNLERVGVVGLGTGTLAAYAKDTQIFDFFELDPRMVTIARKYFTYLDRAKGKVNITLGDGRIALQKLSASSREGVFDILIMDAYSADSVPLHLLSTEAVSIFKKCLKDTGVLIFHTSNRYMEVEKILGTNAASLGAHVFIATNKEDPETLTERSLYLIVSWNKDTIAEIIKLPDVRWVPFSVKRSSPVWTDHYSNPLSILKLNSMLEELKRFKPFYWE